jgi:hypothetical protein
VLYTVTSDSTLRIFLPVLDAPQHLQLHASVDLYSSLSYDVASKAPLSAVFWLDREVIRNSLEVIIQTDSQVDDSRYRKLREIQEENWDSFLRVLADGSIILTAIAASLSLFPLYRFERPHLSLLRISIVDHLPF